MKPISDPRNEGKCNACIAKSVKIQRAGNYCDHCNALASHSTLIYLNKKTSKRYCTDCRAIFRKQLIDRGFDPEKATKIMLEDFILVNDPTKKVKTHKRR